MTEPKLPYLVQRVLHRDHTNTEAKSVDRNFSFDYMGSSEFEWGALPSALRLMRDTGDYSEPKEIKAFGHTVWYVGSDTTFLDADALFADQIQGERNARKARLKEASFICRSYGTDNSYSTRGPTIGWWAIDAVPPWCLFMQEAHAQEWVECLKRK